MVIHKENKNSPCGKEFKREKKIIEEYVRSIDKKISVLSASSPVDESICAH